MQDVGLDQSSLFETDDLYESSDHDEIGNLGAVLYFRCIGSFGGKIN